MEIRNWVDGDQPTGRLTVVPNGKVSRAIVHNYTKDHEFIWDEIVIPITYTSDWEDAIKRIQAIIQKKQAPLSKKVKKQIENLSKRYYIENRVIEPGVFVKLTDNWIELHIRYITDTTTRRVTQSEVSAEILREIQNSEGISIASSTMRIVP
jgi:small-conductance mechanosensitive channel